MSLEKPMVIGIDLQVLLGSLTGIGVYVQQIVSHVSQADPSIEWVFPYVTAWPSNRAIKRQFDDRIAENVKNRIHVSPRFGVLHDLRPPSRVCKHFGPPQSLFHITNSICQFDRFSIPTLITVHDLAWMRLPKSEVPSPAIKGLEKLTELVKQATHVICDSECTRTDVLEFIGRDEQDVTTIHLAPRPWFVPEDAAVGASLTRLVTHDLANRPYFLAISTIDRRKNYVRLIRAFSQVHAVIPEVRLVIVGSKGNAFDDVSSEITKWKLADVVHLMGRLPDTDLLPLLWRCQALVYPSLYEGFGIPALEAMATGAPVISSTAGSLGEVVGEAALIVDPLDEESIARAMIEMMESSSLRSEYQQRALQRVRSFQWQSTAQKTLEIYRRVAAVGPSN
jgi:glycosyltransferase involved in cell wall biosynthesis